MVVTVTVEMSWLRKSDDLEHAAYIQTENKANNQVEHILARNSTTG